MKKILLVLLAPAILTYAQPQLIVPVAYSGPQQGGSISRLNLPALAPGTIYAFNNLAPHRPTAGVCAGDGNWLYGMLMFNGTSNSGALYKIQRDGTGFTVLQSLSDPSYMIPYYHTDGYIYYTESYDIKKLNTATNTVTTVGGTAAIKTLLIDAADSIYYTFMNTIKKIKTDGTGETTLYTFTTPAEGSSTYSGLTESPGDTLWGLHTYGGSFDGGTLYSIKKDGTGFTLHHHFTTATGIYPDSKLVYFDGKLYGTTTQGGNFSVGVLYTIMPDGSGYRVLYHFEPGTPAIGQVSGNISISSNGRIFGTFSQFFSSSVYGPYNGMFKVDTSGENFETFFEVNQRENGKFNLDPLLDGDETIFLPTVEGGRHDGGVLSTSDTSGNATSLFAFGASPNGFRPAGGLIKATDGKLYGVTQIGGADGSGVIYSMNADGTGYTKLYELTETQGYEPVGKLLEASDGKLYGACKRGGVTNWGSLYRLNKNGTGFQVIYQFPNLAQGFNPNGSLVEDASGVLYGTTLYGNLVSGVVFKINKDGSGYTVLQTFNNATGLGNPMSGLLLQGNYLYGSCSQGGTSYSGGVFRIKTDGSNYEVLHLFDGTDGRQPSSIPIIASNGKLYGTADIGGANNDGVLYRMDVNGNNFSVLKHFSSSIDGSFPSGGIIQGSDGLIYGTAAVGGPPPYYGGTVYKINLDGTGFTLLKAFNSETEGQSAGTLLDLNGNFNPLPVQWLSFTAQKSGSSVLLSWKTATEQNSSYFEMERSPDAIRFNKIGAVAAAGNSNSVLSYSFSDQQPLKGMNFYRLKQVDLDGTFNYSKIVSIKFDKNATVILSPNPVKDVLNVQLLQANNFTSASVFDATGKLLWKQNITSAQIQINTMQLSKGWYTIRLEGRETEQHSFIKE